MFAENVSVATRRPLSGVVVFSLLFHALAAVAFWAHQSWKLDRLSPKEPPVFALAGLPALPAAAEKAPAPIASSQRAATPSKRTSETLQPSPSPTPANHPGTSSGDQPSSD